MRKRRILCLVCALTLLFSGCSIFRLIPPDPPVFAKVTFYAGEGAAAEIKTTTDGKVELPQTPAREGYTFDGWFYSSDEGATFGALFVNENITQDVSVYAKYTQIVPPAVVKFYAGEGAAAEIKTVTDGKVQLPDAEVREGYTFDGWFYSSDGGITFGALFVNRNIMQDVSVYAKYTKIIPPAKVTFVAGDGVEDEIKTAANGKVQLPDAEVREGYTFDGWFYSSDGGATFGAPFLNQNITQDVSVYAKYIATVPAQTFGQQEFEEKYMTFIDDIPVMRINTAGGVAVTSQDVYTDATVSIESDTAAYSITDWQVGIRGRGNTTWTEAKKPYRIKAKEKTSIFGLPAAKNWVLLANYYDKSLIRSYFTHMLGRSLETGFCANIIYVEVYFNESYEGLYVLADQTETGKDRVDVEGVETDAEGNITDLGFMLELDWKGYAGDNEGERNLDAVEGTDYIDVRGIKYFLKYPKHDDKGFEDPVFFAQAVEYIRNYLTLVNGAMSSPAASRYAEANQYCNLDTFMDYGIVQELVKNVDCAQLSVFMHKSLGGKLSLGPLWDFDLAIGNSKWISTNPEGWHLANRDSGYRQMVWVNQMLNTQTFYEAYRARYIQLHDENIKYAIDGIDAVVQSITDAAHRNFERWDQTFDIQTQHEPDDVFYDLKTWEAHLEFVKNFLTARDAWLYGQLNDRNPIPNVSGVY